MFSPSSAKVQPWEDLGSSSDCVTKAFDSVVPYDSEQHHASDPLSSEGSGRPPGTPRVAFVDDSPTRNSMLSFAYSLRASRISGCRKKSGSSILEGSPRRRCDTADGSVARMSRLESTAKMRHNVIEMLEMEREAEEMEQCRMGTLAPIWVRVPRAIVENTVFILLTTVLTLYALTGDDVRLLATRRSADFVFDVITACCIFVFVIELTLSCLGKKDYLFSFFFWLDSISTGTLVLDITVVNDALFASNGENVDNMKNSRTARIGARSARVVRVLRLLRIMKLYKTYQEVRQQKLKQEELQKKKEQSDAWLDVEIEEDVTGDLSTESQVGKKLSAMTTRRCVIIILTMMMGQPALTPSEGIKCPQSGELGAAIVESAFKLMYSHRDESDASRWRYEDALLKYVYDHDWQSAKWDNPGVFWIGLSSNQKESLWAKAAAAKVAAVVVEDVLHRWQLIGVPASSVSNRMASAAKPLVGVDWQKECSSDRGDLYLGVPLIPPGSDKFVQCPFELRKSEWQLFYSLLVTPAEHDHFFMSFFFDKRQLVQEEAKFNLFVTLFICVVICVASMMFSRDARRLVLEPLETMMVKVNLIRINPLIAATFSDDSFKQEQIRQAKAAELAKSVWRRRTRLLKRLLTCAPSTEGSKKLMETSILEKTIIKLGTLLSLGLGTAGMNIISHNMSGKDTACISAMVAGSTVPCIIGHVRIMDFGTFTEVLQNKVMAFVNQVAEIVHGTVDAYCGAPGTNNGDSFMIIWTMDGCEEEFRTKLGDMSLMACCMIQIGINKSHVLATYRTHPSLQRRLGSQCRVSIAIGLHVGWAIEGALGSEYKIDASYVSPNVSIAESAQVAADIYGTSTVLTEAAHRRLSKGMASKCRLIDRVKIRGSLEPMNLFALDLDLFAARLDEPRFDLRWNARQRLRARQFLEAEKISRQAEDLSRAFHEHLDIREMRRPYTQEFLQVFGMGYQNYSQGEWRAARRLLLRALDILGFEDGPSATLLRYMGTPYEFEAPRSWKGFHPLEDTPYQGHFSRARQKPVSEDEIIKRPSGMCHQGSGHRSAGRHRSGRSVAAPVDIAAAVDQGNALVLRKPMSWAAEAGIAEVPPDNSPTPTEQLPMDDSDYGFVERPATSCSIRTLQ